MTAEQRLKELGITLPQPANARANYHPVVRSGNQLFISGQISEKSGEGLIIGRLGETMDVEAGQEAARTCAIGILAQIHNFEGTSLDQVERIVKLTVMVNSAPDFTDQHHVANGASDLLAEILGDPGRHARSALGVASLPLGVAVEIDAIVDVKA